MVIAGRRLVAVFAFLLVLATLTPPVACSIEPVDQAIISVDIADAAPASNITSKAMIEARHILRTAYEWPITQREVSRRLEAMMRSEGADGDLSFPTLVMSGSELTSAHGDPYDDDYHVIDPLTDPIVMIDVGCKFNGFCSDVTRTFFFENATQEMFDAYNAVLTAHEAVLAAVGPGVEISDLDAIIEVYLANYTEVPGVSLLYYWGHGVGEYVHEEPLLYNVHDQLNVDDVIAIEPGIYFDTGWAVRIEDTVRVTETGAEVLSHVPRDLEDVMIHPNQPYVDADITVTGYAYGSETTIEVAVSDSASRSILGVDWFDGYSWSQMDHHGGVKYNQSYAMTYSYSGRLDCMTRIELTNDTYYFRQVVTSFVESSGSTSLDPPIPFSDEILPPGSNLFMTYSEPGAEMMRIRFRSMTGGFDQILIEDSSSRPVNDYCLVIGSYIWTPWVSGDSLNVHVVATEPEFLGGVAPFSFSIDRIEFFDADLPQTTTTTTPTATSTTQTTTTTTPPPSTTTSAPPPSTTTTDVNESMQIVGLGAIGGILILVIIWIKRK